MSGFRTRQLNIQGGFVVTAGRAVMEYSPELSTEVEADADADADWADWAEAEVAAKMAKPAAMRMIEGILNVNSLMNFVCQEQPTVEVSRKCSSLPESNLLKCGL